MLCELSPKNPKLEVLHIQKKCFEGYLFHGSHFEFSQFPGVAQSCNWGNQTVIVLEPHGNTNLKKKTFIVLEISRLMY